MSLNRTISKRRCRSGSSLTWASTRLAISICADLPHSALLRAHVIDPELGFQRKFEVDAAANDQISSRGILDALLNGRDEIVDVDRPDRDRDRDNQHNEQTADGGENSPEQAHRLIVAL